MSSKNEDDLFDSIVNREPRGSPTEFDKMIKSSPNAYASRESRKAAYRPVDPKLSINIYINEEVSSIQEPRNKMNEVDSHVILDGSVTAHVLSLGSTSNQPFCIHLSDPDMYEGDSYQYDTKFVTLYGDSQLNVVTVPRSFKERFRVANYHRSVIKKFMPVEVDIDVVRKGNLCKVVVIVQSKRNAHTKGTMEDLVVAMAVPPTVIGKTLKVMSGDGRYDPLKRIVKYKVDKVEGGKTLRFEAEVEVAEKVISEHELPKFPVVLRCLSKEDTVSSIEVNIEQLKNHPVSLNVVQHRSFKILHRLP